MYMIHNYETNTFVSSKYTLQKLRCHTKTSRKGEGILNKNVYRHIYKQVTRKKTTTIRINFDLITMNMEVTDERGRCNYSILGCGCVRCGHFQYFCKYL